MVPAMAGEKIAPDVPTLLARLAPRRAVGDRIVFTNGCFDLLHPGHVRYLAAARALGDLLVLGLNTDDSVRRSKGPGRPILSAPERAEVLAALTAVDHIIFFSEDTPLDLIRAVAPAVLAKGADWALQDIVGRSEVEATGGTVARVDIVPGVSTTELIRRIRSSS